MAQNSRSFRNGWYFIALMLIFGLAGSAVGDLIGQNVSQLSFMSKYIPVGMENPIMLDFYFIKLTFGISFRINVASLIGMIIGFYIYRRLK